MEPTSPKDVNRLARGESEDAKGDVLRAKIKSISRESDTGVLFDLGFTTGVDMCIGIIKTTRAYYAVGTNLDTNLKRTITQVFDILSTEFEKGLLKCPPSPNTNPTNSPSSSLSETPEQEKQEP